MMGVAHEAEFMIWCVIWMRNVDEADQANGRAPPPHCGGANASAPVWWRTPTRSVPPGASPGAQFERSVFGGTCHIGPANGNHMRASVVENRLHCATDEPPTDVARIVWPVDSAYVRG